MFEPHTRIHIMGQVNKRGSQAGLVDGCCNGILVNNTKSNALCIMCWQKRVLQGTSQEMRDFHIFSFTFQRE